MLSRLARRGRYGIATTVPPAPTATQLAMVTTPAGARDSTVFSTQPAVRLKDAGGNNVAQSGVSVTVGINTGSGTLGPPSTTAVTDGSGIATFAGLFIAGSGSHSLAFGSAGLTGVNSDAFTVNAATKLALITDVGGAVVDDVAFPQQPVLELQDANSLAVTKSGVSVTASKATGTGTLAGTTAVNTASTGRATYTNLKIQGTGNHSLSWASSGLTGVTGGTFSVQAAGGAAPGLVEDFSTYTSTANMLTNPRGIFEPLAPQGNSGAQGNQLQLDTGVGLNEGGYSLTKSLRMDLLATGACDEDTVGLGWLVPGVNTGAFGETAGQAIKEVWWEIWWKYGAGSFSLQRAVGCGSPPDHKTVLTGFNTDGWGRADFHAKPSQGAGDLTMSMGNSYLYASDNAGSATTLCDGTWRRTRCYNKVGTSDQGNNRIINCALKLWVGDSVVYDRSDLIMDLAQGYSFMNPGWRNVRLGNNYGTPRTNQQLWVGRLAIWTSNPGW